MPGIRPTRQEVSDRFPVLGFTVNTGRNPLFEVVLMTDPTLGRSENKTKRSAANFYSTRATGPLRSERGEGVHLVSPTVLSRFAGQKLYYGLATFPDASRAQTEIVATPNPDSPWINLRGLTGRGSRRMTVGRVTPRGRGAGNGYGGEAPASLEWAGDIAQPGTETVTPAPAAGPAPGTANPPTEPAPAPATQAGALDYDDGFGPLPVPPVRSRPLAVVQPTYTPSDAAEALRLQAEFLRRYAEWRVGVSNTSFFPHSAICRLEIFDSSDTSGDAVSGGTGFYIAPDCILTAAHNVVDKHGGATTDYGSIRVIPGKNGPDQSASSEPFGSFTVQRAAWIYHPSYDGSRDFDLAVIRVKTPPPHGGYFDILEELRQSLPSPIIVCGYPAGFSWGQGRQHMDGDHIRTVEDETFRYNLQTDHGESGGPVYYVWGYEDEQAQMSVLQYRVAGVHVSGPGSGDDPTLNIGCRLTDQKIQWIHSVCPSVPVTAQGLGARTRRARALSSDISYEVHLIPQPNKLACWAASMAMLVGFRRRVSLDPETLAAEVGRSLRTSYGWDMLEAVKNQFGFQDIKLPDNASLYYPPEQWHKWLNDHGPLWVTTIGAPSHAIIVHGISGDLTPDGTTVHILNPWDINTSFDGDQVDFNPFNNGAAYSRAFNDFASEFGNLDLDNYGRWRVLYLPPSATAQASARAQSAGQSFDIHWTDVPLIAQLQEMSCWEAAADMVSSWAGRSYSPAGPDPQTIEEIAQLFSLETQPAQSYTIDAFRNLLETKGPLWLAAKVPGFHAVVVTGLYGNGAPDGSDTFVRIQDPWDRDPGTPGQPGAYLDTHNVGSKYILSWRQLMEEYEAVPQDPQHAAVNVQILHNSGTGGRRPSVSHAQSWRAGAVSRPLGAGVVEIASVIVGAVMTRIMDDQGDVKWELDKVDGVKKPWDNPAHAGPPNYTTATLAVPGPHRYRDFLVTEDHIYADFEIRWQYNGHSVGNISITPTKINDAINLGLMVKATVLKEENTFLRADGGYMAGIPIQFTYHFGEVMDDNIAITDLVLYGDGRVTKRYRW